MLEKSQKILLFLLFVLFITEASASVTQSAKDKIASGSCPQKSHWELIVPSDLNELYAIYNVDGVEFSKGRPIITLTNGTRLATGADGGCVK